MNKFSLNSPTFDSVLNDSAIVTNGLVLNLDVGNSKSIFNGQSTWNDLMNGHINGSMIGSPPLTSSSNTLALSFNGSTQNVNIGNPSILQFQNNFTLEAWINIKTRGNSYQEFFSQASGIGFGVANVSGSVLYLARSGVSTDLQSSYTPPLNNWIQLAATVNSSNTINLYSNGNIVATGTKTSTYIFTSPIVIAGNSSSSLVGLINTIRMYNRALSSAEILQNYNANKRKFGL